MCSHCKRKCETVVVSLDGVTLSHPACAPAEVIIAALRALGVRVGTS